MRFIKIHHFISDAQGKKYKKKDSRCKNIHSYGIKIASPPPDHVFLGQKSRLGDQQFYRAKKFSIEMGNIVKKMSGKMPYRFFRFQVFLSANMAISSI